MWIIKILLVISAIATRAEINGLQNDGYSYDRPAAIPAELAFYLNIPAGHDPSLYILKNEGHFNQHPAHSHFHHQQQQIVPQSISLENHRQHFINTNQLQLNEPSSQYIPPAPSSSGPILPFIKENSGFRHIVLPHHQQQQNIGYNHQFSSLQQHHQLPQQSFGAPQQYFQYQVQPRNLNQEPQNEINFNHNQEQSALPFLSQELQPPSSIHTLTPPTAILTNQRDSNHRFMASISNSYNAPLPFPIGVVPLKFDPLPLKTNLRQEKLLPITSYEAKRFYKK